MNVQAHADRFDIGVILIREMPRRLFQPAHDGEPARVGERVDAGQFVCHEAARRTELKVDNVSYIS